MIIILNILSTIKRQIPTPVPREKFSEQTEHGTKEHNSSGNIIIFKQYKTPSCKSCPAHSECTRSKKGRVIQRTTFAEYYERNRRNFEEKEHLYKRRQAIVEHPLWYFKTTMGVQLYSYKEGNGKGKL